MSKEEGNSSFNESLLKEDFDPASLKIAELKTVLTSNEIGFKAHDKKAALVKLVEENLDTIKKNVEKDGITTSSHGKVKVTKKRESSKKKRKSATPDALEKSLEKSVRHVKSTPISTPVKEEKEEEEGNSSKVVAKNGRKNPREMNWIRKKAVVKHQRRELKVMKVMWKRERNQIKRLVRLRRRKMYQKRDLTISNRPPVLQLRRKLPKNLLSNLLIDL